MTRDILKISTDERFASALRYIMRRLSTFTKGERISTYISQKGGRSELVIALASLETDAGRKDEHSDVVAVIRKLGHTIVDSIADIIITDCKSHYIETSLKLPIDDEISKHAFIRALSNFDSEADKTIAKSLIRLTPVFLLDSFYQFMIDDLKVRWNEVCSLANENACYLVCAGTFRELLRFLISSLESRENEVHLFERANGIEVLTGGLKPVKEVYVNEDLPQDIQVVSKLISIAPKKIYLHQDSGETQTPLINFIQGLFGGCIQVIRN